MHIMFFDTETTGKPINYNAPMTDLDNWPRIIQQGWMVADEKGDVLVSQKHLVKPDGWVVPNEDFWIRHGYTQEQNEKEGVPIGAVLDSFVSHLTTCDLIVAHNINFDYNVVGAEMIRAGKKSAKKGTPRFCTMIAGTDICRLPGKYGYKFPKLEDLHRKLFNKDFDGAHDALADVTATKNCFFEMAKRGFVKLNGLWEGKTN